MMYLQRPRYPKEFIDSYVNQMMDKHINNFYDSYQNRYKTNIRVNYNHFSIQTEKN